MHSYSISLALAWLMIYFVTVKNNAIFMEKRELWNQNTGNTANKSSKFWQWNWNFNNNWNFFVENYSGHLKNVNRVRWRHPVRYINTYLEYICGVYVHACGCMQFFSKMLISRDLNFLIPILLRNLLFLHFTLL